MTGVVEAFRSEGRQLPLVSVVMPSFNQASYIAQSVASVLQQDYEAIELVVIDGGSLDGTLQVLERLAASANGRLRWYSSRDSGPAEAINRALQLSRGEYIGWLNSDDLYAEGAVERALNYFWARPETMLVYGRGEHVDQDGKRLGTYPSVPPPLSQEALQASCPVCQPTVFFRREVLEQVSMLDTRLSLAFDYDLWLRVMRRYPYQLGFIEDTQAFSRLHKECKTLKQRLQVALESMEVTGRLPGGASPRWFLTWLDEFFAEFPFGAYPEKIHAAFNDWTAKARSFLAGEGLVEFDRWLISDARIRTMLDDAYVSIFPDGWTGPSSYLRIRMLQTSWRRVKLTCRHAPPHGGELNLIVRGNDGKESVVHVGEPGNFDIELELPEVESLPAYCSFQLLTGDTFVPAQVEEHSPDRRELGFLVMGIELFS